MFLQRSALLVLELMKSQNDTCKIGAKLQTIYERGTEDRVGDVAPQAWSTDQSPAPE